MYCHAIRDTWRCSSFSNAVSKNVHFCYDLVEAQLPRFVDHARHFIHLSIPPCYDPDPPERWKVVR